MDYAVELGVLETNPIRALKWTAPKVSSQVDRRSVVNPCQARALLKGVSAQQPSGRRLAALFAVMYYAGLRPEEAINLHAEDISYGGVYPTQVAEWAGHSVDVLLRIYAKCVVGQDELAKRRISEALRRS